MRELPVRKTPRLQGYDYSRNGAYYITVCTRQKDYIFCTVKDDIFDLTRYGIVAERNITNIPLHIQNVRVDKYVVMPDHVHMILIIDAAVGTRYIASVGKTTVSVGVIDGRTPRADERTPCMASLREKSKQTVSRTIQQYKASVSRDTGVPGLWQPRYYDRIIRDEDEYQHIHQYIDSNPTEWIAQKHYLINRQ